MSKNEELWFGLALIGAGVWACVTWEIIKLYPNPGLGFAMVVVPVGLVLIGRQAVRSCKEWVEVKAKKEYQQLLEDQEQNTFLEPKVILKRKELR